MTGARNKRPLAILGAGGFAEEIADLASAGAEFEPVAFIEGVDAKKCGRPLRGLPVVWIGDTARLAESCATVCAVGTPKRNGFIQQALAHGLGFITLVHPSASIFASASLGVGTIVSAGAVIAAGARLSQHVIVNRGSLVGHHVSIGDFTTISPGANIAGGATIGEGCYVGMGAIVL